MWRREWRNEGMGEWGDEGVGQCGAMREVFPLPRNRRTTGRNAWVASAGASSVSVHQILADFFKPLTDSTDWEASAL